LVPLAAHVVSSSSSERQCREFAVVTQFGGGSGV
jgi:hypothetical protein